MPARPTITDRPPTIYDISRRAEVAVSTVSKVLGPRSGAYPISPETRARVLDAARDLGYELDPALRPRRGRRTGVVAVIYGTPAPPAHAVYEGMSDRLGQAVAAQGYRLEFLSAPTWEDFRALMNTHPMDGCLLLPYLPPGVPDPRAPLNLPMVVLNDRSPLPVPQVIPDDRAGMTLLVEHLLGLGHRRILYADILDRPQAHHSEQERREGYEAAMVARGLVPAVYRGTAAEVLAARDGATAIITYNNQLALALVPELRRQGIAVPGSLSLACGTDLRAAELVDMTSLAIPMAPMIDRACAELFALIQGHAVPMAREVVVLPSLMVRGSTGPVP